MTVFSGSTLYLPDDLARAVDGGGGSGSGEAPRTLSWTAVMPAFLNPHFTCIDDNGDAHVYVIPKVTQVRDSSRVFAVQLSFRA